MAATIVKALGEALGKARVGTDREFLTFLARDALHPERLPIGAESVRPLCAVRPQTTEEVATVVRLANTHQTPVIPVGGGSGLMGGAATVVPGIVLDLGGLQEIHIRPADRLADVGAGVTIRALNQAAEAYGLLCGHDPWSVAVATVGGAIAANSLGYLGGRYGAMGDQVLGVEVVLPTGKVLTTRAVEKASTGPALQHLFIGAEGCLGIVTRATVRLFPLPQERLLQGWEFQDFATGFAAIQALLTAGLRPALLDYGDQQPSPYSPTPTTLIMGYEGVRRVTQAEAEEAAAYGERHHGRQLPQHEVQEYWEKRHELGDAYAAARAAGQSWHRQAQVLDYIHVALPITAVLEYRRQALELLDHRGLRAHQTGIWVQSGLFSIVYSGGSLATMGEVHRELLMRCQDMQGAMEYCHGVGTRLAPLMAREHGTGLEVLRGLKRSLDPLGILNPGKLGLEATAK